MADPQRFQSPLAPLLDAFLHDKRARGYRYSREEYHLRQLDRFLVAEGLKEQALPRELVDHWLSKTAHRRPSTHRHRQILIRQLASFLQLRGCSAYRAPLAALVNRLPFGIAGRREVSGN